MVNMYLSLVLTACHPLKVECSTCNARRAIPMLGRVLSVFLFGCDRSIVQGIARWLPAEIYKSC